MRGRRGKERESEGEGREGEGEGEQGTGVDEPTRENREKVDEPHHPLTRLIPERTGRRWTSLGRTSEDEPHHLRTSLGLKVDEPPHMGDHMGEGPHPLTIRWTSLITGGSRAAAVSGAVGGHEHEAE